jgi:hypothetical protein
LALFGPRSIGIVRIADALGNRPDVNIAETNVPAFLSVVCGSAAGEFGHGAFTQRIKVLWVFVKSCGWISRKFNRERPVDSGFLDFDRRSDFVRESEMVPQARYWRRREKNFGYCNEAAAVA